MYVIQCKKNSDFRVRLVNPEALGLSPLVERNFFKRSFVDFGKFQELVEQAVQDELGRGS